MVSDTLYKHFKVAASLLQFTLLKYHENPFHPILLPVLVFASSLSLATSPGRMKTSMCVLQNPWSLPPAFFKLLLSLHYRTTKQPWMDMLTALFLRIAHWHPQLANTVLTDKRQCWPQMAVALMAYSAARKFQRLFWKK